MIEVLTLSYEEQVAALVDRGVAGADAVGALGAAAPSSSGSSSRTPAARP